MSIVGSDDESFYSVGSQEDNAEFQKPVNLFHSKKRYDEEELSKLKSDILKLRSERMAAAAANERMGMVTSNSGRPSKVEGMNLTFSERVLARRAAVTAAEAAQAAQAAQAASQSPFVSSRERPIRRISSLSSEGSDSLPSRVSSSSFQEPNEIISQQIISQQELQNIDRDIGRDIGRDLANELKNAGVVKAPISVSIASLAQQRRAFAEQTAAASAEQAAAAAAAARESMAATARQAAAAPPPPVVSEKSWLARLFSKGGKHTHYRRKKSKNALSRKNCKKRYSVKAKRRNRRKSRR